MTHGSRFAGGYQFPATSSAPLKRGRPVRAETLPNGYVIEIVPLEGGRAPQWDVCYRHEKRGDYGMNVVHSEAEARDAFERFARELGALDTTVDGAFRGSLL
jgi:hypothetical protein